MATRFLLFITVQHARVAEGLGSRWLRRSDSNRRPSGYEPDELPLLHSAISIIPPGSGGPAVPGDVRPPGLESIQRAGRAILDPGLDVGYRCHVGRRCADQVEVLV